jgi:hypothetical protein
LNFQGKKEPRTTVVLAKPSQAEIKEEVKAMRTASSKLLASKKSARDYLVAHGFITRSGKLTSTYNK